FLEEARKFSFIPFAIEPNPRQALLIRSHGIECEERPLVDAFPGRNFDVIYHCDVTSHFHDLVGEFRRMKQRLRPGGLMMFETGNFADLDPQHYPMIPSFQYPDHLFFLGQRSIDQLLSSAGFRRLAQYRYSTAAQLAIGRHKKNVSHASASGGPSPTNSNIFTKRVKAMIRFGLTYILGRFTPLHSLPQTIITVAS